MISSPSLCSQAIYLYQLFTVFRTSSFIHLSRTLSMMFSDWFFTFWYPSQIFLSSFSYEQIRLIILFLTIVEHLRLNYCLFRVVFVRFNYALVYCPLKISTWVSLSLLFPVLDVTWHGKKMLISNQVLICLTWSCRLDLSVDSSISLSATHLQKLRLNFLLASPSGKAFKPHQVWILSFCYRSLHYHYIVC